MTSLVAQTVKCLPTMRETWVWYLGQEDPLEKEMAAHTSTLAWKIPWTEEPGRLQPKGSQRVWHNWATSLSLYQVKGDLYCLNAKNIFCIYWIGSYDLIIWFPFIFNVGSYIKRFANVGTSLHSYNRRHLAMMSFLIFQFVFVRETGVSSYCSVMILLLRWC